MGTSNEEILTDAVIMENNIMINRNNETKIRHSNKKTLTAGDT